MRMCHELGLDDAYRYTIHPIQPLWVCMYYKYIHVVLISVGLAQTRPNYDEPVIYYEAQLNFTLMKCPFL